MMNFGNMIVARDQMSKLEYEERRREQIKRMEQMGKAAPSSNQSMDDFVAHVSKLVLGNSSASFLWGFLVDGQNIAIVGPSFWVEMGGINITDDIPNGFFDIAKGEFVPNPALENRIVDFAKIAESHMQGFAYSADFYVDNILNKIAKIEATSNLVKTRIVFAENEIDEQYELPLAFKKTEHGDMMVESEGATFVVDREIEGPVPHKDVKPGVLYKCAIVGTSLETIFVKVIGPQAPVRMGIHHSGARAFFRSDVEKANQMDGWIHHKLIETCIGSDFTGLVKESFTGEKYRDEASAPFHMSTMLLRDVLIALRMASDRVRIYFPKGDESKSPVAMLEAVDGAFTFKGIVSGYRLDCGAQRG